MPYVLFCLLLLVCSDCVAVSTYAVSFDTSLQHVAWLPSGDYSMTAWRISRQYSCPDAADNRVTSLLPISPDVRICFDREDDLRPADLHIDDDAKSNLSRLRWNWREHGFCAPAQNRVCA